ncbi:MAG TPA: hypothetical protein VNQ80_09880 [Parapedobacter sp.]|uniref:hypothetical protein n=1 Tax=Parapedobacter sp. TaxID=1958893 RepID=UPI002CE8E4B8|nr:hypothetical protein [Parapedobacter sp.]HWK57638.1 hypothetical protein [Parapedobacter sp.]
MQRMIMGMIALFFITAACKKDPSEVEKLNERIQGSWKLVSNKIEYFDGEAKDFEDIIEADELMNEIDFMPNLRSRVILRNGEVTQTEYNMIRHYEELYLELLDAAIFESHVWKITSFTETAMEWKAFYSNIQYENTETGEIKISDNIVITLLLERK